MGFSDLIPDRKTESHASSYWLAPQLLVPPSTTRGTQARKRNPWMEEDPLCQNKDPRQTTKQILLPTCNLLVCSALRVPSFFFSSSSHLPEGLWCVWALLDSILLSRAGPSPILHWVCGLSVPIMTARQVQIVCFSKRFHQSLFCLSWSSNIRKEPLALPLEKVNLLTVEPSFKRVKSLCLCFLSLITLLHRLLLSDVADWKQGFCPGLQGEVFWKLPSEAWWGSPG